MTSEAAAAAGGGTAAGGTAAGGEAGGTNAGAHAAAAGSAGATGDHAAITFEASTHDASSEKSARPKPESAPPNGFASRFGSGGISSEPSRRCGARSRIVVGRGRGLGPRRRRGVPRFATASRSAERNRSS